MDISPFKIKDNRKVNLQDISTKDSGQYESKPDAAEKLYDSVRL